MESKWYCPQKGQKNESSVWKTSCKICCSVCQNKCHDPPCSIPVNQLCCWRRTLTEIMMEEIIPDQNRPFGPNRFGFGMPPHEFYYKLRQYEFFKRKKRHTEWEKHFINKFEREYGYGTVQ